MTSKIESLIDELPGASKQRVEKIVAILEGVLSDVECKYPAEDDTDLAYECQCIPKAQDVIALIRAWNVRDLEQNEGGGDLKRRDGNGKHGESEINTLSEELKIIFKQIPLG
jgi:hypothetical protein